MQEKKRDLAEIVRSKKALKPEEASRSRLMASQWRSSNIVILANELDNNSISAPLSNESVQAAQHDT